MAGTEQLGAAGQEGSSLAVAASGCQGRPSRGCDAAGRDVQRPEAEGGCGQQYQVSGVEVVPVRGSGACVRVARWAEGRGEVLYRLWGVWTFLPYVLGSFLKPVGFYYGSCWRIDLQGRGGQNGCEEVGQVAFSVAGEGGGAGTGPCRQFG